MLVSPVTDSLLIDDPFCKIPAPCTYVSAQKFWSFVFKSVQRFLLVSYLVVPNKTYVQCCLTKSTC